MVTRQNCGSIEQLAWKLGAEASEPSTFSLASLMYRETLALASDRAALIQDEDFKVLQHVDRRVWWARASS